MAAPTEAALRLQIVETLQAMAARGLNRGTSGNVSARLGESLLITPTGVAPEALTAESIVRLDADGAPAPGSLKPSSEWRMHLGILRRRPDCHAVVHCHSRHATILACAGRPIPAVHYMVAVGGGAGVPLAPYAIFGSAELADGVADVLDGRYAALMANHGQIVVAPSLGRALVIAEEIEEQAAVYWGTLLIGGPNLLTPAQMGAVAAQFRGYGQSR